MDQAVQAVGRDQDERFMSRALELARVPPFTSPNPRVGAVAVRDQEVIAEGSHLGAGSPHAEAVILEAADLTGATVYVNLEPCSHHGRMPPCAPALVDAGVRRVVAAHEDPDPRVKGWGFKVLEDAGIEVTAGILEQEARRLNAPFIHHRSTGRPYVSLKLALSIDGRMGAPDGSSRWITGPAARRRVHARRVEADAVLVGAGTVTTDDPMLVARDVEAARQPARVVVDRAGRVRPEARLFMPGGGPVVMATTDECPHEVQTAWKEAGAEVLVLPRGASGVDLMSLLEVLGRRDMIEVLCEGGATLATSLLREDLVDRLEAHLAPVLLGSGGPQLGDLGIRSIDHAPRWDLIASRRAGDDTLVTLERSGR